MTDVQKFKLDLNKFSKHLKGGVKDTTDWIVLAILRGTVMKNPVLTGVSRSSWVVGIGVKAGDYVAKKDVGIENVVAKAKAQLQVKRNPYTSVYISNYVPYILKLEGGSSQRQAPQGMLEVTLEEVSNQIRSLRV